MKDETRILELLSELLQKQDRMQESLTGLQQDVGGLKQEVGGLKQEVGGLKQDVGGLKQEVGGLKQEVGGLKQEVGGLKQEVGGLKQDMQEVIVRLGQVEENQQSHQKILRTLVVAQQNTQQVLERIFDLLDTITRMQRDHGQRLDRLENPDRPGIAA